MSLISLIPLDIDTRFSPKISNEKVSHFLTQKSRAIFFKAKMAPGCAHHQSALMNKC